MNKWIVPQQIRQTLLYLKTTVLQEKIHKVKGLAEAFRVWNYPYEALEEILANSLYHRDYQTREPVEIRIYPVAFWFSTIVVRIEVLKRQPFRTGQFYPEDIGTEG